MTNALTIAEPRMQVTIANDDTFRVLQRYAKIGSLAARLSKIQNEAEVMFIILAGFEYGLSPIAAIRNIYIVDGKPTVSGQMLLALINRSGLAASIEIPSSEDILKAGGATVRMKRRDRDQWYSATFTHEQGKAAGLVTKFNWKNYWWRMCLWRAVSHCASVAFPDVVEGLYTVEEIAPDVPVDESGTPLEGPRIVAPANVDVVTGEIVEASPAAPARTNGHAEPDEDDDSPRWTRLAVKQATLALFDNEFNYDAAIANYCDPAHAEYLGLTDETSLDEAIARVRLYRSRTGKAKLKVFEDAKTREAFIGACAGLLPDDAAIRDALDMVADYPVGAISKWRGDKATAWAAVLAASCNYHHSEIAMPPNTTRGTACLVRLICSEVNAMTVDAEPQAESEKHVTFEQI